MAHAARRKLCVEPERGSGTPFELAASRIGDFNGNGRDDLMWRNEAGALSEWLTDEGGRFAWNPVVGYLLPTEWEVVATGDYNGDGRDDLLWRHSDGTVTNWLGQNDGDFFSNHALCWLDSLSLNNIWNAPTGLALRRQRLLKLTSAFHPFLPWQKPIHCGHSLID